MEDHRGGGVTTAYKVVAPLVLVQDADGATHHVYQGAELDALSAEQAKYLLGLGFIEKASEALIVPGEEFLVPESIHVAQFDAVTNVPVSDPPAKVAPKADWVDYAVSRGADEAEAESLTKAELVELYG